MTTWLSAGEDFAENDPEIDSASMRELMWTTKLTFWTRWMYLICMLRRIMMEKWADTLQTARTGPSSIYTALDHHFILNIEMLLLRTVWLKLIILDSNKKSLHIRGAVSSSVISQFTWATAGFYFLYFLLSFCFLTRSVLDRKVHNS